MKATENKMNVEIWSDVMCPFCYIGKRKFEKALEHFSQPEKINIIWKSYELNPGLKTDTSESIINYLCKSKGIQENQARQMMTHVKQMGTEDGLTLNLETTIVANSFNAHRFSHYAKSQGKQNEAEERLFHAYFSENLNTDDKNILLKLGEEIGLSTQGLKQVLDAKDFSEEVFQDEREATQIGIRGVPFFAFNRKYAVSGAQPEQVFLNTLKTAFSEWEKENNSSAMKIIDGKTCTPEGECK